MLRGVYRVDSIKKAARREAWFHNFDDTDNKTYNFFGRYRPKRLDDPESGDTRDLTHVSTENDAPSPIEARRRANDLPPSGPRKAGTFPNGPASNGNLPSSRGQSDDIAPSEMTSKDSDEKGDLNPADTNGTNGMVDRSVGNEGTRKRKSRKFMPWKKSDEVADADNTRTDTSESKKKHPKLTIMGQLKAVFGSWINILLIMVPVGIAVANVKGINKIAVFVINFVAIVPLAAMLSYATEELAMYIGETLGGLLNATFGNAVELIIGVIALAKGEILIVQTSLIGSMLSNLLLVMGMCFFLSLIHI